MKEQQPNNPLHGITLEMMLVQLVDKYGWDELADRIPVNCFMNNPSIKSSLNFFRKTPWARKRWKIFTLIHSIKKHNQVV